MSSSNDIATTALRRSQLYRRHIEMGAVFEALSDGTAGDSAVVSHYRTSEEELTQAQHLGLADLSTLPRMGFKGLGTPGWQLHRESNCRRSPIKQPYRLMAHWSPVYHRASFYWPVISMGCLRVLRALPIQLRVRVIQSYQSASIACHAVIVTAG